MSARFGHPAQRSGLLVEHLIDMAETRTINKLSSPRKAETKTFMLLFTRMNMLQGAQTVN